jgi:RNA polymerase sigma factor (sigma-70 family)
MSRNDLTLVHAVLAGDTHAASALYALVGGAARQVAARLNLARARPPFDTDDLAQTVHQQLFHSEARALRRYTGESALSTWLYTIAYRHALRALRVAPIVTHAPEPKPSTPDKMVARKQTVAKVREVIETLPEGERLLIQMLFEDELSAPAAGRLLGISAEGARMRKMRLLRRLADRLKGLWP